MQYLNYIPGYSESIEELDEPLPFRCRGELDLLHCSNRWSAEALADLDRLEWDIENLALSDRMLDDDPPGPRPAA